MLLVLMYHQVYHPNHPERLGRFKQHLAYIADTFPVVFPGEMATKAKRAWNTPSLCLVFDDAYYDFYHMVYPLLQSFNLKAVLGIPTAFIQEGTADTPSPEIRLSVPYPQGLEAGVNQAKGALCTWDEIKKMVDSGLVMPASHSHTHANLTKPNVNLTQEFLTSKNLLQEKLSMPIETFVFPYGAMNPRVLKTAAQYYKYNLRIGSAINQHWNSKLGLIYRVDADHLWRSGTEISASFLRKLKFKYYLNKIRAK